MDISTLREIDSEAFAGSHLFQYEPEIDYVSILPSSTEGYDQIQWLGEPITTYFSLRTFTFFDGTGIAMCSTYEPRGDIGEGYHYVLRMFAFGCEHKYNELRNAQCRDRGIYHAGRCYHVYECEHCGHIMAQDSSD